MKKLITAIVLALALTVAPGCASNGQYHNDGPDAGEVLIGALVVAAVVGLAVAASDRDDDCDKHRFHHKY